MHFRLLGPLTIECEEGQPIHVTAAKQRAVVAALLLHPNVALPIDTLIEVLWNGRRPPSARATLLNYMARLRRAVGADIRERLHTTAVGYRLHIYGDHELDYLQAAELETRSVTAARTGDWDRVDVLTRQALGLWRGEPLEDVFAARLHRDHVHHLIASRSRLHDLRIDALLHLGQYDLAATDLEDLIQLNPLREAARERLLIALYGCGRRAEAFESFRTTRQLLRDELGVDPSSIYQVLQRQILDGAPVADLLETLWVGRNGSRRSRPAIAAAGTTLTTAGQP
jgi:DNA-binding SARP family transcriptional activator